MSNDKDWWEYYIEGKVIRRDDTSQSIVSTLEDWFDGKRSAMKQFVDGKPVKPKALQREIDKCLTDCVSDNERPRLLALQIWIIREAKLAEAAKELREAEAAFNTAAQDAGLDAYHAYKIATGPCA